MEIGVEQLLFQELLEVIEFLAWGGDPSTQIKGIAYDSRQVEPGFLFVAVKGLNADGHEYISQAVEQGAAAIVMQREVNISPGVAWILAADTRHALALLSTRFYGCPSSRMKMIGVTGTNGKTTTTNLLAAVLNVSGQKTGLIGTIHNRIGSRILPVKHTTPESLELQRLLHEMSTEGVDTCVMEVSSHALSLHRVDGCEFDVVIFTNLTQDHLDFHRDMDEYLESKLRLFRSLALPGEKKGVKYSVINADDQYAKHFIEASSGKVYTYGVRCKADVMAEDVQINSKGVSFTVKGKWGSCKLQLKLTGLFNVYNALAAFSASLALGIPAGLIIKALEESDGVSGRFELVNCGQDFAVIVDYAHTPDGLENVLKTARQIAHGRLITVFGCGGDRDRTKRPLMGGIATSYSDFSILTSDNPRTEEPLHIISEIEKGISSPAAKDSYLVEADRRRAIQRAISMACPGDVVVIAGKGHEDYQVIGLQKFPFDDRLEAAAALAETRSGGIGLKSNMEQKPGSEG